MSKFTPGPWHWDGNVCDYDRENEAPWIMNGDGRPVLMGEMKCENPANAVLLVAAPELYEALEKMMNAAVPGASEDEILDAQVFSARVMAKARGEA